MKWIKWVVILFLILQFYEAKELNATNDLIIQKEKQFCDSEIKDKEANIKEVKAKCLDVAINYEAKKNYNKASWYYLLGGQYQRDITFLKDKINENFAKVNLAHAFVLAGNFKEAKKLYSDFLSSSEPYWANNAMQEDYKILFKIYPQKKEYLQKVLTSWSEIFKPFQEYKRLYAKYEKAKKNKNYQVAAIYLEEATKLLEKLHKESFAIYQNYFDLGIAYYDATNYKKALEFFQKALSGYEKKDDIEILKSLANLYGWIGDSYYNLSNYKDAIVFYNKKLNLFKIRLQEHYKKSDYAYILYRLSDAYNADAEYANSLMTAKKAVEIYKELQEGEYLADLYWFIANDYCNLQNSKKAIVYYKKTIQQSKKYFKDNYKELKYASNLFDLAICNYYAMEYKEAIKTALKAEVIYKKYNRYIDLAYLYSWIGDSYYNGEFEFFKKYENAALYFEKERKYFLKALLKDGKEQEFADNLLSLAMAYNRGIEVKKSLYYAKEAEWIYKESNQNKKLSQLYSWIADDYEYLNHYKLAIEYLNKKTESDSKVYGQISTEVAKDYKEIATDYASMKKYEKAEFYNEKALNILQKVIKAKKLKSLSITDEIQFLNDWKGLSSSYYKKEIKANRYDNIAEKYRAKRDYKNALKYYKIAYYIRANISGEIDVDAIKSYTNLGDIYFLMKNYKSALKYYKRAFNISKNYTLWRLHPETQTLLLGRKIIKVYKKMGNIKKAYYYSKILNNNLYQTLKEKWEEEDLNLEK